MGRARVPARREQVCTGGLAKRSIGSIVDFDDAGSRGSDPSRRFGPCFRTRQSVVIFPPKSSGRTSPRHRLVFRNLPKETPPLWKL